MGLYKQKKSSRNSNSFLKFQKKNPLLRQPIGNYAKMQKTDISYQEKLSSLHWYKTKHLLLYSF